MSNIDVSSRSTPPNPFTQLISDFRGKNLPSEQIEADYNNTLNYPNNWENVNIFLPFRISIY